MNNRERIARFAVAAAIIGTSAFLSACGNSSPKPESPTLSQTQESLDVSWDKLPARERLQRLASKDYALSPNLDRQKETVVATAEEFARLTNSSSKNLIESVIFLNGDIFVTELSKELNTVLSPQEVEKEKQSRLAITTSDGKIFINQDLLGNAANGLLNLEELKDSNPRTISETDTLIHEFIHKIKRTHSTSFEAFSLRLPNNPDPINFDTVNGFKIVGKDSQGKEKYLIEGDEAITDLAAGIIAKRIGVLYFSNPQYISGAMLVKSLNQITNVSDDDFLGYVLGEKDQAQMLAKWGSHRIAGLIAESDVKTGALTLAEIAISTKGLVDYREVEKDIAENFK